MQETEQYLRGSDPAVGGRADEVTLTIDGQTYRMTPRTALFLAERLETKATMAGGSA